MSGPFFSLSDMNWKSINLAIALGMSSTLSFAQPFNGHSSSPCDFVQRDSTRFVCKGSTYRFSGTNFWYGPILGSEGQGGNRQRLAMELDSLHALGLDNLRILVGADGEADASCKVQPALQTAPGVYNDTLLAGLDYLLAEMGKRDMKAVLYLNNSWEWSGGYGFYLEHAGFGKCPLPSVDGYTTYTAHVSQFASSELAHQFFYNHVRFIISRQNRYTQLYYKDDPTIMAWQIGNEPRAFSDKAKEPFAAWLAEASAIIRSLDSRHLISIGSEGIYGCEIDTALYERISADPNIDYMTIHIWPTNWQWARRDALQADLERACELTTDYVRFHSAIARRLGKPLVIEEFGYPRDGFVFTPASPTTSRDAYYSHVLKLASEDSLIAGVNFWAWGGTALPQHVWWQPGEPYTGDPAQEQQGLYSVFACDSSTLELIREHTKTIRNGCQ